MLRPRDEIIWLPSSLGGFCLFILVVWLLLRMPMIDDGRPVLRAVQSMSLIWIFLSLGVLPVLQLVWSCVLATCLREWRLLWGGFWRSAILAAVWALMLPAFEK